MVCKHDFFYCAINQCVYMKEATNEKKFNKYTYTYKIYVILKYICANRKVKK